MLGFPKFYVPSLLHSNELHHEVHIIDFVNDLCNYCMCWFHAFVMNINCDIEA